MNVPVVVLCMSLAGASTSLAYPAYTVNMLDIAPRYASVVMGLCNTVGTTAGFISPVVVGFMTEGKVSEVVSNSHTLKVPHFVLDCWITFLSASLSVACFLFVCLFVC